VDLIWQLQLGVLSALRREESSAWLEINRRLKELYRLALELEAELKKPVASGGAAAMARALAAAQQRPRLEASNSAVAPLRPVDRTFSLIDDLDAVAQASLTAPSQISEKAHQLTLEIVKRVKELEPLRQEYERIRGNYDVAFQKTLGLVTDMRGELESAATLLAKADHPLTADAQRPKLRADAVKKLQAVVATLEGDGFKKGDFTDVTPDDLAQLLKAVITTVEKLPSITGPERVTVVRASLERRLELTAGGPDLWTRVSTTLFRYWGQESWLRTVACIAAMTPIWVAVSEPTLKRQRIRFVLLNVVKATGDPRSLAEAVSELATITIR
jgi:hypothetical protein